MRSRKAQRKTSMSQIPSRLTDPAAFQEWTAHPTTQEFLAFLKSRQSDLMEAWGRGTALTVEQQAQAVLLGQLSAIRCDDVREYYEMGQATQGELA
jgi:hypothetical protein